MSESVTTAMNCFEENIRLFGDARTQPEKYNLYNGFFNLAEALQQLENQVQNLQRSCDKILSVLDK